MLSYKIEHSETDQVRLGLNYGWTLSYRNNTNHSPVLNLPEIFLLYSIHGLTLTVSRYSPGGWQENFRKKSPRQLFAFSHTASLEKVQTSSISPSMMSSVEKQINVFCRETWCRCIWHRGKCESHLGCADCSPELTLREIKAVGSRNLASLSECF